MLYKTKGSFLHPPGTSEKGSSSDTPQTSLPIGSVTSLRFHLIQATRQRVEILFKINAMSRLVAPDMKFGHNTLNWIPHIVGHLLYMYCACTAGWCSQESYPITRKAANH